MQLFVFFVFPSFCLVIMLLAGFFSTCMKVGAAAFVFVHVVDG
jgi:hypothetical protein